MCCAARFGEERLPLAGGRAPPLPDGFKADAARVFDATYDALLPYIEEL